MYSKVYPSEERTASQLAEGDAILFDGHPAVVQSLRYYERNSERLVTIFAVNDYGVPYCWPERMDDTVRLYLQPDENRLLQALSGRLADTD